MYYLYIVINFYNGLIIQYNCIIIAVKKNCFSNVNKNCKKETKILSTFNKSVRNDLETIKIKNAKERPRI